MIRICPVGLREILWFHYADGSGGGNFKIQYSTFRMKGGQKSPPCAGNALNLPLKPLGFGKLAY
jgi:hypothetical protein